MCGRYVRTSPEEVIRAELTVRSVAPVDLRPRYNVCPGEDVAAIVNDGEGNRLGALRWGFLPHDPSRKGARPLINARAETAGGQPAFRDAFRRRRCVIVADGFYEWRKEGARSEAYFFRRRDGRPFGLAGLWERSRSGEGKPVPTCVILTCPPNERVAPVHDRMPVMLDSAKCDRWLDPSVSDPQLLLPLLAPCPAEELEAWPVSSLVSSPRNDSPECIAPLTPPGRLVLRP